MAANKTFRFGPIALTATLTTNLLNPPTATGGVNAGSSPQYIIIRHMRVTNKTSSPHQVTLYIGATGGNAAGTEFVFNKSVPANDFIDIWDVLRLDSTDFLVGGADAVTSLSITGEGEIGVAG